LTDLSTSPQSPPGTVNPTGNSLVNQPTVREVSTSANSSSRPWPSIPTNTALRPVHRASTRPNALNNTSLTCVRYTSGTRCSNAAVSSRSSRTEVIPADANVFGPGWSTGSSVGTAAGAARQ
jgi:hypothetical protein